jgi:hypothetical protein
MWFVNHRLPTTVTGSQVSFTRSSILFSRTQVSAAVGRTQTHKHTRTRLIMPDMTEDMGRKFNYNWRRCVYTLPTDNTRVILSLSCTSAHPYEPRGSEYSLSTVPHLICNSKIRSDQWEMKKIHCFETLREKLFLTSIQFSAMLYFHRCVTVTHGVQQIFVV